MGDTRIEESGENWRMVASDSERPTIQVIATVRSVERTETVEHEGKKRSKRKRQPKQQPFGFSRAIKPW